MPGAPSAVMREHRSERAPDPALDVRRELGRSLGGHGQDGLVGGAGPVVTRDRVEVAAVLAQSERGTCYQALGHDIAALAEQMMSLAEDDVQLAGVVVSDFQPDQPPRPADSPRRRVNRTPRHERPGTQLPAIRYQQDVEGGHQPRGLFRVGLDQRVGHERQEVQQHLVRPVGELEPLVTENPVVVPVEVGDAVPHDVLPGRIMPGVSRGERVQVVKLAEELGLVQPPPPRTFLLRRRSKTSLRVTGVMLRDWPGALAGAVPGSEAIRPGWHPAPTLVPPNKPPVPDTNNRPAALPGCALDVI